MEKFQYVKPTEFSSLPKAPGVYAFASPKALLYIGKAQNIQERVKNHFQQPAYRDNLFMGEVAKVGFLKTDSEVDALILESQLIKKYGPKYNVMWKDDKKYFYVVVDPAGCIVRGRNMPRVFLTHQPVKKLPAAPPGKPSDGVLRQVFDREAQTESAQDIAVKAGFPPKAKQFVNEPALRRDLRSLPAQAGAAPSGQVQGLHYSPRGDTGRATPPKAKQLAFGPFTEGKAIRRVLRLLRRVFPYYTAKKHPSVPCTWCHLHLCPGPNPDQSTYKKSIAKFKAVLNGKRNSVLKILKTDMEKAAKAQDFERAAVLRDQLVSLERIIFHASLFNHEPAFAWSFLEKELQKLLSTKKRIRRLEAYDISNIQGNEATGSQVTFVNGVPAKEWYRKYKIRLIHQVSAPRRDLRSLPTQAGAAPSGQAQGLHYSPRGDAGRATPREAKQLASRPNDFAMMHELLSRRLKHPEWPYPDLVVIDGGKGQLSAAQKGIPQSIKNIQLVALAKKQNELFFPGKRNPVLLRDLPRPLENLFLHIRDEAHRFAISYHRLLHSKQVRGS